MRRTALSSLALIVLVAGTVSATFAGQCSVGLYDDVVACGDVYDPARQSCFNTYFPAPPSGITPEEAAATAACVLGAVYPAAAAACLAGPGAWVQDIIDNWGNHSAYETCVIIANSNWRGCVSWAYIDNCDTGGDGGEGPGGEENDNTGCPSCQSPIVLDLGRRGIALTSSHDGVAFDIDGSGRTDRVAWLRPGGDDGWLGLDRNGNACLDDGRELFGNNTPQPSSTDPNGYLALAVFDQEDHGGNGDGIISAQDGIYEDLVVWVDKDHDGFCRTYELLTLRQAGVAGIGLDHTRVPLMDEYGNGYWLVGTILLGNGEVRQSVDVYLTGFSRPEWKPGTLQLRTRRQP